MVCRPMQEERRLGLAVVLFLGHDLAMAVMVVGTCFLFNCEVFDWDRSWDWHWHIKGRLRAGSGPRRTRAMPA